MKLSLKTIAAGLMIAAPAMLSAAVLETISIDTDLVPGDPVKVTVITPEGYDPGTHFPTVYLLHGYSGDYTNWWSLTQPRLPMLADQYGMVMVMPDGRDSWYWDAPANPKMQMETFIVEQLVPYIDRHYPTIDDSSQRAITGLSMGGHGAMWLAFRHSDVFGNAGSTSGGLDISTSANKWRIKEWLGDIEKYPQNWHDYTVINLVPQLQPGQVNIIFDCGTDDIFAAVNDRMHQALLDAKIPHDYISRPGNHSHPYWRNAILHHLLFFNENFKKAQNAATIDFPK